MQSHKRFLKLNAAKSGEPPRDAESEDGAEGDATSGTLDLEASLNTRNESKSLVIISFFLAVGIAEIFPEIRQKRRKGITSIPFFTVFIS